MRLNQLIITLNKLKTRMTQVIKWSITFFLPDDSAVKCLKRRWLQLAHCGFEGSAYGLPALSLLNLGREACYREDLSRLLRGCTCTISQRLREDIKWFSTSDSETSERAKGNREFALA